MKPRLLDLFCGAGGATKGYQLAGFHVTGVDVAPQPHYCGDEFHQADAMAFPLGGFDVVHASPPCQGYTATIAINLAKTGSVPDHPKLIEPVRERLRAGGAPYVIENVPRAPLLGPVTLCGSMFGLRVRRHRLFESDVLLLRPRCDHRSQGKNFVGVYGDHPERRAFGPDDGYERAFRAATIDEAREAMGMPWADWKGCKEAIPPAYTEFIGTQLLAHLGEPAA